MKSILAFLATFFAVSLSALCAAGAEPPEVYFKNPELPVVLDNPGAEFQDEARPGASYGYVGASGPAFGGVRDVVTPE
jgi:hypothetical protein